jgi:hypothetical protein
MGGKHCVTDLLALAAIEADGLPWRTWPGDLAAVSSELELRAPLVILPKNSWGGKPGLAATCR